MIEVVKNRIHIDGRETKFLVQELVPKSVFARYGSQSVWMLNDKGLRILDFFRTSVDASTTVNNWHTGGTRQYSGFRPGECGYLNHIRRTAGEKVFRALEANFKASGIDTYELLLGSYYSQHKQAIAWDVVVKGMTSAQVAKWILDNSKAFLDAGVTTIEDPDQTPTWTHLDGRITGITDKILVVNP